MRVGVPNEAYDALEGDDKDVCRDLKRWNREFREGKFATGLYQEYAIPPQLVEAANDLIRMPDGTLEDIHAQEEAFRALVESDPWRRYDRASDAFISAFFTPKTGSVSVADTNGIPTTDTVWRAIRSEWSCTAINLRPTSRRKWTTVSWPGRWLKPTGSVLVSSVIG